MSTVTVPANARSGKPHSGTNGSCAKQVPSSARPFRSHTSHGARRTRFSVTADLILQVLQDKCADAQRPGDQRGDHRSARQLVDLGVLNPESRWQYLGDAA